MKAVLKIALAVALLFCIAYPQNPAFNPMRTEWLSAMLVNEGSVSATSGEVYDVQLNISIPQETAYQAVRVDAPAHSTITTNRDNTVIAIGSGPEKARVFNYRVVSYTNTSARHTSALPKSYSAGSAYAKYMQESAHIVISDEIGQQARNITRHYTEDIDKVAALAVWVNKNMRYDISLVGGNRTSLDAYRDREGVCVDYTNLFIAMARSLGYPSRSVLGYVYSPDYGWQLHAWAEVYIGEWVGVDPTWLEAGYIDATHIPMHFSEDTEYIQYANAYVTDRDADIIWSGRGSLGQEAEGITIQEFKVSEMPYTVLPPPPNLTSGSTAAIILNVNSPDYRIFTMTVSPCTGVQEIVNFQERSITKFLHPGMNNIIMPFSVPSGLNDAYVYTCPIVISHSFGTDTVTVNVVPGTAKSPLTAQLSSLNATDAVIRIISVNGGEITIISDRAMEGVTLPPSFTYAYNVNMTGRRETRVAVQSGSWSDVIIITSPGASPLTGQPYSITSLSVSAYIPSDKVGRLEAAIDASQDMQPFSVKIYEDGQLVFSERPAGPPYRIDYEISPRAPGRHTGRMVLDSGFEQYEHPFSYEVFEPKLGIARIEEGGVYRFEVSGPYKSYTLYVDGEKINPKAGVRLKHGMHSMRVEWVDLAGYSRVHTEEFDSSPLAGCITPAAVLMFCAVALFAYLWYRK
ncbi:MAG: transglutaminase-like domain-containing protein [Candidatus Micrarchaeia archaeon]